MLSLYVYRLSCMHKNSEIESHTESALWEGIMSRCDIPFPDKMYGLLDEMP
jgi:hypothetical protein